MSTAIKKIDHTPNNDETALPNSRRIYVEGEQPGVRVPFREIDQNATRNFDGTLEENSPVRVYDTSGPWGDPSTHCEVSEGLPTLRRHWILERGDVEEYEGRDIKPIDDGYLTFEAANHARQKEKGAPRRFSRFAANPFAGKVRPQRDANALRAAGHHHSGNGIHRHSRKPRPLFGMR